MSGPDGGQSVSDTAVVSEGFINLAAVKASEHGSDMLYIMEGNVPTYVQSSGMWSFQFKRFHRKRGERRVWILNVLGIELTLKAQETNISSRIKYLFWWSKLRGFSS